MRKPIALILWGSLLFSICFGLGYPTLGRYDPTADPGLSDSLQYFRLVQQGPQAAVGHWKYRILVPYLAKPVYWVVRGRLGNWNPVSFALLIVNSVFCAAAAFIVSLLAYQVSANGTVAIAAAFAYLLNFLVSNFHLSGLVDSAEAFLFALLTGTLISRKWILLPVIGLLMGLAKETSVPIAFVFAATWVWIESPPQKTKAFAEIILMTIIGLVTVLIVRSVIDQTLVTPWHIAAQERTSTSTLHNLLGVIGGWKFWLALIWLPFLAFAAKRFQKGWFYGAIAAALAAFVLSVFNDAGGNAARPIFNVLGPLFTISFALMPELLEVRQSQPSER